MKFTTFLFKSFMYACEHGGKIGLYVGVSYKYYCVRFHIPNLIHPKDLSERILSSITKNSFLRYADYADKVKVRDYVKEKGLGHLLLDIYGVWDDPDKIDVKKLPEKFILKPNNGSGGHVICRKKEEYNPRVHNPFLKENLKRGKEYFFEPHYRKIVPKILCEELMDVGPGRHPTDYKFTCIKGEIVDVFLAEEDSSGKRKYATVDLDWNELPYTKEDYLLKPIPPKPKHLGEMIEYAKILSKDFEFVRVDLYEFDNKVYFGELTFSPWGGYMYSYTDEAIRLLGEKF